MKTRKFLIIFVLPSLFLAGCSGSSGPLTAEEGRVPVIQVQGQGTAEAVPDEAVVTFGVSTDARMLEKAYNDNTEKMNVIVKMVKKLGVEEKDMKTSSYSVHPVYPVDERGRRLPGLPESFSVRQQLTVQVRDLAKLGDLIDEVISGGTNEFQGIQFTSSRMDELEREAKADAARNAKANAELLAESLGVRAGKLLRVTGESMRPYGGAPVMALRAEAAGMAPQIQAGSLEVTATCHVEYEILQ